MILFHPKIRELLGPDSRSPCCNVTLDHNHVCHGNDPDFETHPCPIKFQLHIVDKSTDEDASTIPYARTVVVALDDGLTSRIVIWLHYDKLVTIVYGYPRGKELLNMNSIPRFQEWNYNHIKQKTLTWLTFS